MPEIKVKVTKHSTRKFLLMYYDDPQTGERTQRSTKVFAELGRNGKVKPARLVEANRVAAK